MKLLSFLPAGALLWMFAISSYSQSALIINGSYSGDQTWQADTVKITGHTSISGQLVIEPGTLVEFQGNYTLEANGIKAIGNDGDEIVFTVHDTLGFSNLETESGGWGGITDYGVSLGDSSVLRYCRFEYGKRITDPSPYFKGLLKFGDNTGRVLIDHCVFEHNFAKDGAILKSDRNTELDHCRVNGNYSIGISLRMGDIKNCSVKNNKGNGIEIWDKEYTITNDTVIGNSGYGLYVYQSKNVSVRNNFISGNTLGVKLFEVKTGEFYGKIADKTIWEADTIKVASDVTIGKQLVIRPGTCVKFQGHYELAADSLYAVGSIGDSITFTIQDTTGFSNRNILDGGWKKISVASFNEFNYCRFMFGKNIDPSPYPHAPGFVKKGLLNSSGTTDIKNSLLSNNYSAALFFQNSNPVLSNILLKNNEFVNFTMTSYRESQITNCTFIGNKGSIGKGKIIGSVFQWNTNLSFNAGEDEELNIEDCVFQNNKGLTISAGTECHSFTLIKTKIIDNNNLSMHCGESGSELVIGNIICNNTFSSSFEFYWSTAYIVNNTFYNNIITNGSAFILGRGNAFRFYNNILYGNGGNNPKGIQISFRNMERGDLGSCYGVFMNNLIEGGLDAFEYNGFAGVYEDNVDEDPQFVNAAGSDFHLIASSPCINTGISGTTGLPLPEVDLDGNTRIIDNRIDIGAYEFVGIPANRPPIIESVRDQKIIPGSTKPLSIKYFDPDSEDVCSVLNIVTSTPHIGILNRTDSANSVHFVISTDHNWEGEGQVQIQITDNHGNMGYKEIQVDASKTVCGQINENTVWASDTIKVACDVTIMNGIALTIDPGTVIDFAGKCQLIAYGSIVAVGNKNSRITFTSLDTSGLYNNSHNGWKGIRLIGKGIADFRYCNFSFAKNDEYGGAISSRTGDYQLSITNCNFYYNSSSQGGAVYIYKPAELKNNAFYNNYADWWGGALFLDFAQHDIVNSLFCNNYANGGGAIYALDINRITNCTFIGNKAKTNGGGVSLYKGSIKNCIVWANDAGISGKQVEMESYGTFNNCIIEGGINGINNSEYNPALLSNVYSADPNFVSIPDFDFHLKDSSIAINTGTNDTTGLLLPLSDLDGNPRIYQGAIKNVDIGAYEYQGNAANRNPVIYFADKLLINTSTIEQEIVTYYDPDAGDTHTLYLSSDNENLQIQNVSGDTSGSSFDLVPAGNWEGRAIITIRVVDSYGNTGKHDCEVLIGHIACGEITGNMIWDSDTIHVTCDITIPANASLTIMPGTVVLFHGYRQMKVVGSIHAVGTAGNEIIFTSEDSSGFYSDLNDGNLDAKMGWNGIFVSSYSNDNRTSVFDHCCFKYAFRAVNAYFYPAIEIRNSLITYNYGTAVNSYNCNALIENCVFSHNTSRFTASAISADNAIIDSCIFRDNICVEEAGAVLLGGGSYYVTGCLFDHNIFRSGACLVANTWTPGQGRISANVFINNKSTGGGSGAVQLSSGIVFDNNFIYNNIGNRSDNLQEGASGAIYAYGNPILYNNTVVFNSVTNGGGGLSLHPSSSARVYNTIFYKNESDSVDNQINFYSLSDAQLHIFNSILQGGKKQIKGDGTIADYVQIDEDEPKFVSDTVLVSADSALRPEDFLLAQGSPCTDAGTTDIQNVTFSKTDLAGKPRILDRNVDIGAYEYSPEHPDFIIQPIGERFCGVGNKANLITNAFGGVIGYQWQKEGINISGETDTVMHFISVDTSNTGNYNCNIITADGIVSTDTVEIRVDTPVSISGQSNSVSACERTDTLLAIYAEGGNVEKCFWFKDGFVIPGRNTPELKFPSLQVSDEGNYQGVMQNACGSDTSGQIVVLVFPLPQPDLGNDTSYCVSGMLAQAPSENFVSYRWNTGSDTSSIVAESSGTYWLEVTDTNNCNGTDSVEVIVNSLPVVDIGGPYEICDHDSVWLGTFDAYNHYQWSSGANSPFTYVCKEGNYWVEVIDTNGCRNTDTTNVIVHPLPYVYLGEDTILHTNDALTLDAGEGFDNYQWNTGAGTQVLPVNTSGTGKYEYWVRVSDSNSCVATDTILITVEQPNAVPGYTKIFSLKVFPNPTTGIVYLVPQSDMDGEILITVIDAGGRLVHKDRLTSLKSGVGFSIDLSGMENGVYLLMIDQFPLRIIKNTNP